MEKRANTFAACCMCPADSGADGEQCAIKILAASLVGGFAEDIKTMGSGAMNAVCARDLDYIAPQYFTRKALAHACARCLELIVDASPTGGGDLSREVVV